VRIIFRREEKNKIFFYTPSANKSKQKTVAATPEIFKIGKLKIFCFIFLVFSDQFE